MRFSKLRPIFRITIIYLIFASLWILFSDQLLALVIPDPVEYRQFQTYKGWLFVLVTAVLLFNTVLREFQLHWEHERELAAIAQLSQKLRGLISKDEVFAEVLRQINYLFQADLVAYCELNDSAYQELVYLENNTINSEKCALPKSFFGIDEVQAVNMPDIEENQICNLLKKYSTIISVPIVFNQQLNSAVIMARQKPFSQNELNILKTLGEIIAQTLYNSDLLKRNKVQIQRLSSLRAIDQAILASQRKRSLFRILLKEISQSLNVDAIGVTAVDANSKTTQTLAVWGINQSIYTVPYDYCDYVKSKKIIVGQPNTDLFPHDKNRNINFSGYAAVSLTVRGKSIGIFEVLTKPEILNNPEWQEDLVSLAQQMAIALDNATMVDTLRETNINLYRSYEETIKGWSRAMALRDEETEQHTQRVTNLTIKMAIHIGLPKEKRIHIKHGAMLHDIGKIGVPDSILLKNGPLTDKEWKIMYQHPVFAKRLLEPISYLAPAIPIPYSHHEKWDGSGYPQGLKGKEIPIEARIFALVDVWDALSSDRPYRKAWSPTKARAYFLDQSGKHFDPELTELFLRLL